MKLNYSKIIATIALVFITFATSLATDYYVDAVNGDNSNNGLLSTTAKKTIQAAADLTNPGDTVFIMNGTYSPTTYNNLSILNILRSGSQGKYITYKPMKGHTPKIAHSLSVTFQVWNAVVIDASYIVFEGIEIEGNNAGLTYEGGYKSWQDYENNIRDWVNISKYNASGISIGKNVQANYVVVRNCKIHEAASGVGGGKVDYLTIENNTIYNNCWYTMYATSGISILDPVSIDANTNYKIIIRNNIVYNNKTLVPWERIDALSDGNGIILDVNIGSGSIPAYVGRYLVENNVSYNNGGGGIHAYKASHIDIINNTAYNNGTVVGYPEIDAQTCSDVKIFNNIMYARTGGNCNGNDAGATYDYNLYYNGTAYKQGPHDLTAEPQFVNLAKDATADFRLKNVSPAINNGSNTSGQFSPKDILGTARPIGFSTDMGAYEYATVVPRAEINIKQAAAEVVDNSGSFDFGDVSSTLPKTVTFTIENLGDQILNLTGTPKVAVTGTGFTLETDAPATVAAKSSVTFQVKLTPTTLGVYNGTISIANDDASENPYNFAVTGYGYDGTKALQTITFNALPVKVIGNADFAPGATTTSALTITYTSSNTNVATITAEGKIHILAAGTSTITASQAGDASTNAAKNVTQVLTVTPVLPSPGSNLVTNPTFDANVTGWSFAFQNSASATIESVAKTGYSSNVGKITISSLGTTTGTYNVQVGTTVFVVKDKNYLISFKGSADVARNVSIFCLLNASPYSTIYSGPSIPLTTTPTIFGTYAFTSSYTGYIAVRFLLGGTSTTPVYIDDFQFVEDVLIPTSLKKSVSENNDAVIIYPNPATNVINVDYTSKPGVTSKIDIYDLKGRLVYSKTHTSDNTGKNFIQLSTAPLNNGLYVLKVVDKNGLSKTTKVMVQKL